VAFWVRRIERHIGKSSFPPMEDRIRGCYATPESSPVETDPRVFKLGRASLASIHVRVLVACGIYNPLHLFRTV
jgi:hypothetical protein